MVNYKVLHIKVTYRNIAIINRGYDFFFFFRFLSLYLYETINKETELGLLQNWFDIR
jgi:hypothetical protein